jgi:hypothetical protein
MIQRSHFQKLYIRASRICRCPSLFVIRYLPEGPAPAIGIGYIPIGVVKEIENLQPELHPLRFRLVIGSRKQPSHIRSYAEHGEVIPGDVLAWTTLGCLSAARAPDAKQRLKRRKGR